MEPYYLSARDSIHPSSPMSANSLEMYNKIDLEEIYEKIDPVLLIGLLTSFIENHMNDQSEGGSSSSEGWLETVGDGTKIAAKTIDAISTEAEKLSNPEMKGVGDLQWVFIGLSVASYAVENDLSVGSGEKECRELLPNILELAKDVKLCTFIFCDYLAKILRFWLATTAAARLEKNNQQLTDVRDQWRKDYGEDKDVFLSHSGKQKNSVWQLYQDLTREHVSCFFDEDHKSLPPAQKFPPLIFKVVEKIKVAVVVLSKEFTSSMWPMLELSAFISAKNSGKNANLKIWPIFFMISPKELSQITKDSPEWKILEQKDDIRGKWQDALKEVFSVKGLEFGEDGNEVHLRDEVVQKVCCLLQREAPQNQNHSQSEVTSFKYWADIGMKLQLANRSMPCPSELLDFQPEGIDQVEDVKKLLDIGGSEQVIAVVIVGMGGIGKSTLAASVIQSLNLSLTDFMFRAC